MDSADASPHFPSLRPTFWIGNVPIYGDLILAPMDGFSDWPYRSICQSLGSAMGFTEFMRAGFVVQACEHVLPRLYFQEKKSVLQTCKPLSLAAGIAASAAH